MDLDINMRGRLEKTVDNAINMIPNFIDTFHEPDLKSKLHITNEEEIAEVKLALNPCINATCNYMGPHNRVKFDSHSLGPTLKLFQSSKIEKAKAGIVSPCIYVIGI